MDGGIDAKVDRGWFRWQPPSVTTFTERKLGVVDAVAASTNVELGPTLTNGAPSGHQLVDQLVPEIFRDAGIAGPPASAVDGNEGGLRRPRKCYSRRVFVFFSNRLGCLGSIALSIVGTALLLMLMRSCG